MRYYTKEHEWVEIQGDIAVAGITIYAQEQLGDIVFIDLPKIGKVIDQHKDFAVVESVKAASDVYAPVSGEVIEVNTALDGDAGLINQSPEDRAWIAKIRLSNPDELKELLSLEQYQQLIK